MPFTQADIANGLIAQLRALDPSIGGAPDSPERLIIDTVAQGLADSQVDLTSLQGSLDFDAKFGLNLDKFLALFGFARQSATYATGFVTFSRPEASTVDVTIPRGTQVMALNQTNTVGGSLLTDVAFSVTTDVILPASDTSVIAPVRCTLLGSVGNVPVDSIKLFVSAPAPGISQVTNEAATTGGVDQESDERFKVRFRNTVFRNMAGTRDQYAALAAAMTTVSKANVVGSISRYQDYLQVPNADDASVDETGIPGNGLAGEWTSALSTIPYSKYIYASVPTHLTNGQTGVSSIFFNEGVDYQMNVDAVHKNRGDSYRNAQQGLDVDPSTGYIPNVSFLNVYGGSDTSVQGIRPGDILLFEHSYISQASRNDYTRNVLNCVDVYINGENASTTSTTLPRPQLGTNLFVNDPSNRFYYQNFQRYQEPGHLPILGNIFMPLFWQPVVGLPDSFTTSDISYFKGIHYWLVEDISSTRGTIRARNGIEWNINVNGMAAGDNPNGPWTGPKITAIPTTSFQFNNYLFDRNVPDLQANTDGAKQVTTDVLVHKAKIRYFKLDVTIIYTGGVNVTEVNTNISKAVQLWLEEQYFGSVIQLSDLITTVHNVPGVDSARWTRDDDSSKNCVTETDINGHPLLGIRVDEITQGNSSTGTLEVQRFYTTGTPNGGTYTISQGANTTDPIAYNANAATVQAAFGHAGIPSTGITGSGTQADPFIVTFSTSPQPLLTANTSFTSTVSVFNLDFYCKDDELSDIPQNMVSGDTVPGVIIRPRAQNTWRRR